MATNSLNNRPNSLSALVLKPTSKVNGSSDNFRDWMQSIVDGNADSFSRFFDTYSLRIYQFALHLTHGNEDLANEIHQITFIRAAKKFKAFESEPQLLGWLYSICRNAYLDHVRKESLFSRILGYLRNSPAKEEHEGYEDETLQQGLERAMASLEPDDLALLKAVYFENKSQKEMATDLGRTAKAVERKIARVRQKLRTLLLKELKDEE